MQPNQMNQQMNTYFIQTGQPLTSMQPNANIISPHIFQQIRVPNNSNFQWAVSNMPNTITLNQPIQLNQNNQRLESKPNENYIMNNRQPMIISGNQIGFNPRFISPSNIGNQTQTSQLQKFSTVQQQPQVQIHQQQQQQPRQASAQIQRVQSTAISENSIMDYKDNSVQPIIASASSLAPNSSNNNNHNSNNKPPLKIKEDHAEEREDPANSKDMVNSSRIAQMVRQIDEHLQLDDDMKGIFSQYLDDFLQNVTENACKLAKLRNSNTLETKDFQYIMEKDWGIYVPGYPSINEKPKQNTELEIHRTRMNIIKKSNK